MNGIYQELLQPAWLQGDLEGNRPSPPCVLTIAGSDSGGGAGIQADIKTFMALGVYGSSVICALTSQNGERVDGIFPINPEFVALQLETVLSGFPVKALKTGMLFSADIIETVASCLAKRALTIVVDPVCVSQSGHRLLEGSAVEALKKHLIPLADLLTPNKPEAELLAEMAINSPDDIKIAAKRLMKLGAKAVLIKGGHFDCTDDTVTDWLAMPGQSPVPLQMRHISTGNNHGTGCTLAAAITAHLGLGLSLQEAILHSQKYLNTCLKFSYNPGKGSGPVNHAAPLFFLLQRVMSK